MASGSAKVLDDVERVMFEFWELMMDCRHGVANENSTLSKMKGIRVLACQMNIDETLDGIVVEIISD